MCGSVTFQKIFGQITLLNKGNTKRRRATTTYHEATVKPENVVYLHIVP